MTGDIKEKALKYARPGTEIVAVNPSLGPKSIESYYEEALATIGVLEEIRMGEAEKFDGYVIAIVHQQRTPYIDGLGRRY